MSHLSAEEMQSNVSQQYFDTIKTKNTAFKTPKNVQIIFVHSFIYIIFPRKAVVLVLFRQGKFGGFWRMVVQVSFLFLVSDTIRGQGQFK